LYCPAKVLSPTICQFALIIGFGIQPSLGLTPLKSSLTTGIYVVAAYTFGTLFHRKHNPKNQTATKIIFFIGIKFKR
jgi:hypothetical protein